METEIVPHIANELPDSPQDLESVIRFLHMEHMNHWDQLEESKEFVSRSVGGKYRSSVVNIGKHTGPSPKAVPEMMEQFADMLWKHLWNMAKQENVAKDEVEKLAVWAHTMLVHIHPFLGGNGRTARSLYQYVIEILAGTDKYGLDYFTIPIVAEDEGEMSVNRHVGDAIEGARTYTKGEYFFDFQMEKGWSIEELLERMENSIEAKIEFSTFWVQKELEKCGDFAYIIQDKATQIIINTLEEKGFPGLVTPELGYFFVRIQTVLKEIYAPKKAYLLQESIIQKLMEAISLQEKSVQSQAGERLLMNKHAPQRVIDIVQSATPDTIDLLNAVIYGSSL